MKSTAKKTIQFLLQQIGYEIKKIHTEAPANEEINTPPQEENHPQVYGPTAEREFIVTQKLHAQLTPEALAAFSEYVAQAPETYGYLREASPEHQIRETLRLGNYHLPEIFNPLTGLARFNPPENIHAMVRKKIYCGDLYYCDLITETLSRSGIALEPGKKYLDFGCSSGRVLWTLSAAYPGCQFLGCDPNGDAIRWAQEALPAVDFFVSPEAPPFHLAEGSLDGVYAISIWSHFSDPAGLRWLAEMHRVIKPGGVLLITTHGFGSLAYYETHGVMPSHQASQATDALNSTGHFFIDIFGPDGDWGVGKSDWGQFFINPTYLIQQLSPRWHLQEFTPRRSENNQDVYLLKRV